MDWSSKSSDADFEQISLQSLRNAKSLALEPTKKTRILLHYSSQTTNNGKDSLSAFVMLCGWRNESLFIIDPGIPELINLIIFKDLL